MKSNYRHKSFRRVTARFISAMLLLLASVSVHANPDFARLSPYPGPEIMAGALDLRISDVGVCALAPVGELVCVPLFERHEGQSLVDSLNSSLGRIVEFSTSTSDLCALADDGQIACINSTPPAGRFQALGNLSDYGWGCAIGFDSELACWNDDRFETAAIALPPQAERLKQVSIDLRRFCGVDLNDELVCWGEVVTAPPFVTQIRDLDIHFGNVDPAGIGQVRSVSLGDTSACIVRMDGRAECFGADSRVPAFNRLLASMRFQSLEVSHHLANYPLPEMAVCGVTLNGRHDCWRIADEADVLPGTLVSALPSGVSPRLIANDGNGCFLDNDDFLVCYVATNEREHSLVYPFPAQPQNFRRADYSANSTELFWDRPEALVPWLPSATTLYEVYRNNDLLLTTENFSSLDFSTQVSASTYTLRPIRGGYAGISAVVAPDTFVATNSDENTDATTQVTTQTTTGVGNTSETLFGQLTVEGSTISWPAGDWYQVQSASDFQTLCEGGRSCAVPAGTFIVINHSTGERIENIIVSEAGDTAQSSSGFVFSRTDSNEYRWVSGNGNIWISETCARSLGGATRQGDWFELNALAPAFDSIESPCASVSSSSLPGSSVSGTGFVFSRTDVEEYRWVSGLDNIWINATCAASLGGPGQTGTWVELNAIAPNFDAIASPCSVSGQ